MAQKDFKEYTHLVEFGDEIIYRFDNDKYSGNDFLELTHGNLLLAKKLYDEVSEDGDEEPQTVIQRWLNNKDALTGEERGLFIDNKIANNDLKIVDIDYEDGLEWHGLTALIPNITTDNNVVTEGRIVRYTAILNNKTSQSVFYDEVTGGYTYNGDNLTEFEIAICENISAELQNSNGDYESIINRLTVIPIDDDFFKSQRRVEEMSNEIVANSIAEEFEDDFINSVVDEESANKLIESINWDNWEDDDGEGGTTGEYFKVESVLWNRLGYLLDTDDNGTDEDSEFYDILSQVNLYFVAIGEKGLIAQTHSIKELHEYFSQNTIKTSEIKEEEPEHCIEDYAERCSDNCGTIEDLTKGDSVNVLSV